MTRCPYCKFKAWRKGASERGIMRYKCQNEGCNRSFTEKDLPSKGGTIIEDPSSPTIFDQFLKDNPGLEESSRDHVDRSKITEVLLRKICFQIVPGWMDEIKKLKDKISELEVRLEDLEETKNSLEDFNVSY
jgi:hypothetical protein